MNPQTTRIFCAFPIFCPSQKMYERNFKSVQSFVEYLNLNPHYLTGEKGIILDIFYGGWSAKQEWFDTLKAYIKNNLIVTKDGNGVDVNFVKVFQYDKNYGKAKIVNDLALEYDKLRPGTQFMYSCDSDIKMMNSQVLFFERLLLAGRCIEEACFKATNQKKPFGMIALDQKGECCHWYEPQSNGAKGMDQSVSYEVAGENGFKLNDMLVWPSDQMGIAGGSIFVNFLFFKHIGGYRKFNTQYAGDDGFLLRDCYLNNALACIIKTLSILHPSPEDDLEYRKWKDECMKGAFDQHDENKYKTSLESEKNWIEK